MNQLTLLRVFLAPPFQAVPLNEQLVLLFKSSLPVVFFLVRDVPANSINIGV
jgi:hypothetical protein